MDIASQISRQIATLHTGETWKITAHELRISRTDFHALSIYLSREAQHGKFSLHLPENISPLYSQTALTVIKN